MVLSYMGAKTVMARWIIEHFPHHTVFVDVFGGGGGAVAE